MQAEQMVEQTDLSSRRPRRFIISFVLLIVVVTSLFSLGTPKSADKIATAGTSADGSYVPDPPSGPWACGGFFQPACPIIATDPGVKLKCDNLKLKVAILIDRSDSVIRDSGSGTPDEYKDRVKLFVDTLYQAFRAENGQLGFLIYAFGTQSVLQYEGDASDPTSYAATLKAIDDIWFRNGETFLNKNNRDQAGFQTRNNQPSEIPFGYDAGHTDAHGIYGRTNWQDAFIKLIEKQSTTYNNPEQGKKIDLAVMFTDGIPDMTDGYDWKWTPGKYLGPSGEATAGTYGSSPSDSYPYQATDDLYRPETKSSSKSQAYQAVDYLRSGNAVKTGYVPIWPWDPPQKTIYPARPKMSVRGIVVQKNITDTADALNFTKYVFRDGKYYLSADFDAALETQIMTMAENVFEDTGCSNLINRIKPSLKITAAPGSPSPVRPKEGEPGIPVTYTVKNTSTSDNGTGTILDVKVCIGTGDTKSDVYDAVNHVCINGAVTVTIGTLTLGEVSAPFTFVYTANFGDPDREVILVPFGRVDVGDGELDGPEYPATNTVMPVEPGKANMPS